MTIVKFLDDSPSSLTRTKFSFNLSLEIFQITIATNVDVGGQIVTTTSTSIRLLDLIQIYLAKFRNQCLCKDLAKVEECLEGHKEVFKTYTGAAKCSGDTVVTAFGAHIDLLKLWNKCVSPILSTGTTSIIHGLSFLFKLGENEMVFLIENGKATPQLISTYTSIVTRFNRQIGRPYRVINESLRSLQKFFAKILEQFLNRNKKQSCGCKHVDIDFKGIMNAGRLLAKRVALILQIALADCSFKKIADSVYEALAVISLLTYDIIMAIQAVLTTMASVFIKGLELVSAELESFLNELNSFTLGINETIVLLTSCDCVKQLLRTVLVHLSSFGEKLAPCPNIGITAADVEKNLQKA